MFRFALLVLLAAALAGPGAAQEESATLRFVANGEDFVRQGFVSKDGWTLRFDHVFVALARVRAYQTNPPYDPDSGDLTRAETMVGVSGRPVVDLARGGETAGPVEIGAVQGAPTGYYNALSWAMEPAATGDAAGHALVIAGTAERDGRAVDFRIGIDRAYAYDCGAFIGDERKGVLPEGASGEVELTFHFDHLFGDAGSPPDDPLNLGALGFEPLAALAADGSLDVSLADLEARLDPGDYQALMAVLPSLGHTGEGHCHEYGSVGGAP